MSKKNKSISKEHSGQTRVKLIANPGAGEVATASSRLEQVTQYLLDAGLGVDVALAKPKKEAIRVARRTLQVAH